ncbi:MAG: protein-disulfide reductase DsbD domain-containing protein [Alphaproteobacteria bacterium]
MKYIWLFFALLFLAPTNAYALAGEWQKDEALNVRLISAVDAVGQDQKISLGLELEMAPNWHTYWRSPGAAGLPPSLDWQATQTDEGNLKDAQLLFPSPKRYTAYGLETVGYTGHIVFPIDATLRQAGKALNATVNVDLLVCSAICIPKNFVLTLKIPEGTASEGAEAVLIKEARDDMPDNAAQSGLILKSMVSDGKSLTIQIESRFPLQAPDVFIENEKNISFAAPRTTINADKHSATLYVKAADTLSDGVTLAGMPLTVTITDGDRSMEQRVVGPKPTIAPPAPSATLPLGLAVLFALIGGFILNLMPCVLPVLSMKILSVVSHGGGEKHLVRQSFLMTAGGILFSFLALAGMTIALKEFGLTLGWGVQFQQPLFLAFLIALLTLFSANLWGLCEIQLPGWLANKVSDTAYHPKLAGDFATGAFATLLATPCTAPFLGTAVGFALASGPLDIVIIFSALGFGMILPYLAIALFPGIATKLPKPGAWMVRLRHVLGFALACTALWLIWVLAAQITVKFATLIGLSMLGIVILLSLRKTSISQKLVTFGLIDFILVAVALTIAGTFVPKTPATVDALWLPFSESAIAADIDEGKVVFVDVTADWCLTCKANKKFILSKAEITERLFHSNVIAMQADWTNPDPVISDFLKRHGRYGIPFNIVFGPGAPQGLVLPEILTTKAIHEALEKAAKPPQP